MSLIGHVYLLPAERVQSLLDDPGLLRRTQTLALPASSDLAAGLASEGAQAALAWGLATGFLRTPRLA